MSFFQKKLEKMEQFVWSLRKLRHMLEQLDAKHLAELVGLDRAAKKCHDEKPQDRPAIIADYVERAGDGLAKPFMEAITVITSLGDANFTALLRDNLPAAARTANPVNLAATLYLRQIGVARQLYTGLRSQDGGMFFHCPDHGSEWFPSADQLDRFRLALNSQLKNRRQPELLNLSCFPDNDAWIFLLHRRENVLDCGEIREMTGCAVLEFFPSGKLIVRGLLQPWQYINFSAQFGFIFFDNWNLFSLHKRCSLNMLMNHGLSIPEIKSPVRRIIATSAALISRLGIVKEFSVSDGNGFLNVMFQSGAEPGNGYKLHAVTLKVIFSECVGEFRLYSDRIDTGMPDKYQMLLEECLFSNKILTVSTEVVAEEKNFWQQIVFIAIQKSMCFDNWRKVLSECVDLEIFAAMLLTPIEGFDHIVGCKNAECGRACMTDVFRRGDGFHTVCQSDFQRMTPIPPEAVALYEFRMTMFLCLLAGALRLPEEIQPSDELTWTLGNAQGGRKWRCRIGVSFAPEDKLLKILMRMCLACHTPTVMLIPDVRLIPHADSTLMCGHQLYLLSLRDHIRFNEFSRFIVFESFERELDRIFAHKPSNISVPTAIQVRPGAKWEDVSIKFKDNHTIVCKIGTASTTLSYWECCMADLRTGKCDRSWLLLLALARAGGVWHVDWQNRRKALREQQQKKELCAALKRIFDIDGLPIIYDRETYEYRSLIRLRE